MTMTTTIRLLLALGAVTVQGLGLTARPGKAETRTFYATQGLSPPAAAGSLCYTHCPLSSPASGRGPLTVLRADRFGAPAESAGPPSVLEVARPLMDAAKGLEMAGTTVVSFCGDDRALFDGGTQLVNAARDLEDAGAMGRMRPGVFADEVMLKLRASGEAFEAAGAALGVAPLNEAGASMERCGEELGRFDQVAAGGHLSEAGRALVAASEAVKDRAQPETPPPKDDGAAGGGWLAGITAKMTGGAQGDWRDAAANMFESGRQLERAGAVLVACRRAKQVR